MDAELRPQLRDTAQEMRERRLSTTGDAPNASWWKRVHAWAPTLLWLTLPGVLLALIGPFGSFAAPLAVRLAYWVPIMAAGGGLGYVTARLMKKAAPRLHQRRLIFALAHAASVTVLMVFLVWGWGAVAFGPGQIGVSAALFFYVGVISLAISMMRLVLVPSSQASLVRPVPAPVQLDSNDRPLLSRRLKPALRAADILALEAEDHYVRVHTTAGADLILLRLSDAIDEISGVAGLRPHRSWWVARAAVTAIRRDNGRLVLDLKNGHAAPVSRAAAADIRALVESRE